MQQYAVMIRNRLSVRFVLLCLGILMAGFPIADAQESDAARQAEMEAQKAELAALREKAEACDVDAQFRLGKKMVMSLSVERMIKDLSEEELAIGIDDAFYWLWKAAENGHAKAYSSIAFEYEVGGNVPEDDQRAIDLYRKSAELEHEPAYYSLARLLLEASEGEESKREAAFWFEQSADHGRMAAQIQFADMLFEGIGTVQNKARAIRYYKKAAESGSRFAQFTLGVIYGSGDGVPKNYVESAKWFESSALRGLPEAQMQIAIMYSQGQGVEQDQVMAYAWMSISFASGNKKARLLRDLYEEELTPEQLQHAQSLSGELYDAINSKK